MVRLASIFVVAGIAATALTHEASAHPGQHSHTPTDAELVESHLFKIQSRRSLVACANSEASLKLKERTIARRTATLNQIRQQRRLSAADVIATSHKSNLTCITPDTDPAVYFGSEVACVLEPEATQGPYYVTGELIRNDIRENQPGVDLYTELQIIDVNTCLPVPDLYVDFWHCNATGVYSGMIAGGNGDSSDLTNVNKTFSRGLAPTDEDGLVQFLTVFPGHYTGRAHHIHVLGSYNGTVLENNTYVGSVASHVGQIFFDQDLITEVESTPVYAANTQPLTLTAKDGIFVQEAATGFDPVVNYVLLGDSVEDGIFSWISIGVDMTRAETVRAAGTYTADGGIINSGGGGGGGGGPPGPPPDGSGFFPPPDGSGFFPPSDEIQV